MPKESKRRITAMLDAEQFRELEALMEEDGQTNYTYYFVYLIMQEKKRRKEITPKRPVGRPKGSSVGGEEDQNLYPAPYKGGGAYTRNDLEGYYSARNQEMPTLPKPLTAKEIKDYE